jgi:hypothetical protein
MYVWYVFYNHTAFKDARPKNWPIWIFIYLVISWSGCARLVSWRSYIYTTDATRYVQTEMMSASITQKCWSQAENGNIMLVGMSLLAAIMKSSKPLVLSISYQLFLKVCSRLSGVFSKAHRRFEGFMKVCCFFWKMFQVFRTRLKAFWRCSEVVWGCFANCLNVFWMCFEGVLKVVRRYLKDILKIVWRLCEVVLKAF